MSYARRKAGTDHEIARIATAQHGLISTDQLEQIGLKSWQIAYRVKVGRLHRMQQGVFAVGHLALRPEAHWLAAVLACGDCAFLSDGSAAALWRIAPIVLSPVHVTLTSGDRRSRKGLVVHRRRLEPAELTRRNGIRTVTPLRAIRDLPRGEQARAANEAVVKRVLTAAQVNAVLPRPIEMTRSEKERRLGRILGRHTLPAWHTNRRVLGHECDFVWPALKLIVEIDGPHHLLPHVRRNDAARDRKLTLAGWRVLRFPTTDLRDAPGEVAAAIALAT